VPVYYHQQVQISEQLQSPPRYLQSTQPRRQERNSSRGSNRSFPLVRDPTLVGGHCSLPRLRQQGKSQTQRSPWNVPWGSSNVDQVSTWSKCHERLVCCFFSLLYTHRHTDIVGFHIPIHGHARDHNPSKSSEIWLLTDDVQVLLLSFQQPLRSTTETT
jgi:hypothetical protein